MIINKFHIENFGLLTGQSVSGLAPGINVFFGENEAGKSTCIQFFRCMFFGFKRGKRLSPLLLNKKLPLGGTLDLTTASGRSLRLLRRPDSPKPVLSDEKGAVLPENTWDSLLLGCTEELYDSSFAFGLADLDNMLADNNPQLRHSLYSTAFGPGIGSIKEFATRLQNAMDDIYRPQASVKPLNRRLAELGEIKSRIKAQGSELELYQKLQAEENSLHELLLDLEGPGAAQGYSGEISGQANNGTLPALRLRKRKLERQHAAFRLWRELRSCEAELARCPLEAGNFAPGGLERLENLLEQIQERRAALAACKADLQRLEDNIARLEPDPALMDISAQTRLLSQKRGAYALAEQTVPALRQDAENNKRELAEAMAELGPDWTTERIMNFDRSLGAREEFTGLEEKMRETALDMERAGAEARANARAGAQTWATGAFIGLLLALGAGFCAWKNFTENGPDLNLYFWSATACVMALASAFSLARRAQWRKIFLMRPEELPESKGFFKARQARADWLTERGLPAGLSEAGAQSAFAIIDQSRHRCELLRKQDEELEKHEKEAVFFLSGLKELLLQAGLADDAARLAENRRSALILLDNLSDRVEQAMRAKTLQQSKLADLPNLASRAEEAEHILAEREKSLADMLEKGQAEEPEEYRRHFLDWTRRAELSARRDSLMDQLGQLAEMFPAGTDRAGANALPLTLLIEELQEAAKAGEDSEESLNERLADIEAEIKRAEEQTRELLTRLGQVRGDLDELFRRSGRNEALPLHEELAQKRDEADALAGRWLVNALALHLAETAKTRFSKGRQITLIEDTSRLFRLITDGEYSDVSFSLDDGKLQAVHKNGETKDADSALSLGTQNQLYLALRFAYLRQQAASGEPLPLIMDDILVNFDARRARNTALALTGLGRENQILFFTCHRHICDLLRETAPQASFYSLKHFTFEPLYS